MTLKELYAEYEKTDAVVAEQKAEYEKALFQRSEAVKAIAEAVAPKKKISVNDKELTIVIRGNTYFFRGKGGSSDAVEVK